MRMIYKNTVIGKAYQHNEDATKFVCGTDMSTLTETFVNNIASGTRIYGIKYKPHGTGSMNCWMYLTYDGNEIGFSCQDDLNLSKYPSGAILYGELSNNFPVHNDGDFNYIIFSESTNEKFKNAVWIYKSKQSSVNRNIYLYTK